MDWLIGKVKFPDCFDNFPKNKHFEGPIAKFGRFFIIFEIFYRDDVTFCIPK